MPLPERNKKAEEQKILLDTLKFIHVAVIDKVHCRGSIVAKKKLSRLYLLVKSALLHLESYLMSVFHSHLSYREGPAFQPVKFVSNHFLATSLDSLWHVTKLTHYSDINFLFSNGSRVRKIYRNFDLVNSFILQNDILEL